jgi:hypothetical protein
MSTKRQQASDRHVGNSCSNPRMWLPSQSTFATTSYLTSHPG